MTKEIIDTRDLQERLDELETQELRGLDDLSAEEEGELQQLRELRDEVGDEWQHGETLIHEDYFTEYAQQLAEDLGVFSRPVEGMYGLTNGRADISTEWPFNCIDWEYAANELKYDYSAVTFQGETYYVRAS